MDQDGTSTDRAPVEEPKPLEQKRPNWFMRARIPLWVALPLFIVGVLFAFFISYPQRSVSSAVERMFRGTENVEIEYCLSNEAAKDPERWRAEERFKDELRSLGIKDVDVRFVSPCPQRGGGPGGVVQSPTPLPPQAPA